MTDAVEVLRRLPIFAGLGEERIRSVATRTVPRTLRRNALLFRKGETCHGLYVVVEGRVQIYRASPDGREQVLHVEGPGRPVAELPLFDGGPYPASARALEDSRLLFLPRDAFQALYRSDPEIADAVIRELGRRLRRLVGLVEKVTLKDVRARVAATLAELAEAADAFRDGGSFVLPQTQEALARGLATTREGVARALASLRREGIIAQEGGRVRVLDAAALDAAARGGGAAGRARPRARAARGDRDREESMTTVLPVPPTTTVNEMIRRHPATVAVFNDFGIDACCGGAVPVEEAARRDGADSAALLEALRRVLGEVRP